MSQIFHNTFKCKTNKNNTYHFLQLQGGLSSLIYRDQCKKKKIVVHSH